MLWSENWNEVKEAKGIIPNLFDLQRRGKTLSYLGWNLGSYKCL